ncbi:MAG: hypothetical protein QN178_09245 [Armatimonadota bacterium]|nr:hypothetical protein [Armatimonadota bacterium]
MTISEETRPLAQGPANPRVYAGVAMVSAATLMQQVALTRTFSVVQWYHFAFIAVGLGLLGFGISGTALTVFPVLRCAPLLTAAWSGLAVLPAVALALLAIVAVPFDAYLMALEPVQAAYLTMQVAALVLPFLFGGLVTGSVVTGFPEAAGRLYAASFLGAAAGALASVPLLGALGGAGAMIGAAACATAGSAVLWWAVYRRPTAPPVLAAVLVTMLTAMAATVPLDLPMSPYKALSLLRRLPDARVEFSGWNAISRVDVIRSAAVRPAPGLSPHFPGMPPSLPGLTVDGDGVRGLPAPVDASFTGYLPTAVAYRLHRGKVLIVGVGVEVLNALHHEVRQTTVLESNPLVAEAARKVGGVLDRAGQNAAPAPRPSVRLLVEHPRTYLRRTPERFDVVQVPPQESFQVVASGAFSLTEHYLYTVEAFRDYLLRLTPGGVLAVTRWIQTPPSEEIRTWAAAVAALEQLGARGPAAASRLVALRSLNTMTILVKPDGFATADIAAIRAFATSRRFDITHAPGVGAEESNRFNVMPQDLHRDAFAAVLDATSRAAFLRAYPFDVRPVYDDRPFFYHFFRWRQVPRILATLGRSWQPFGGGGYLVLLTLLAIVAVLSAGLILAPLRTLAKDPSRRQAALPRRWLVLAYFLALGLAYVCVEIAMLQQMILVLGSPTYAAAAVLSGLLVASGVGSLLVERLDRGYVATFALLVGTTGGLAWVLPEIVDAALVLSLAGRLATLAGTVLLPGVLMGMPFPAGIRLLGRTDPGLTPWAWGINGCASVVGSVLAAMAALAWGFRAVLLLGAIAYAGAGIAAALLGRTGTSVGPGAPT